MGPVKVKIIIREGIGLAHHGLSIVPGFERMSSRNLKFLFQSPFSGFGRPRWCRPTVEKGMGAEKKKGRSNLLKN
jgi:hypothetical protein